LMDIHPFTTFVPMGRGNGYLQNDIIISKLNIKLFSSNV